MALKSAIFSAPLKQRYPETMIVAETGYWRYVPLLVPFVQISAEGAWVIGVSARRRFEQFKKRNNGSYRVLYLITKL
jgi:hypothetical protein